jgi:hypothetical protein
VLFRSLYVPADHFTGTDGFSFKVTAGGRDSVPARVSLEVGGTEPRLGGKALSFDGLNDTVSMDSGLNLANQSFTVEAWVKSTAQGVNNLFLCQGDGSANKTLHLGYRSDNLLLFGFGGNDLASPTAYVDQAWHHLAFTYSSTTKARRIYRDGVLVASGNAVANFSGGGRLSIGSVPPLPAFFKGALDEVRIWRTVRTAAEIETNYRRLLNGDEPGLVAYWRFDEGTGTAARTTKAGAATFTGVLQGGTAWVDSGIDLGAPASVVTGLGLGTNGRGFLLRFEGHPGVSYQVEA